MSKIVERVARALCKLRFLNGGVEDDDGWDDLTPRMKEQTLAEAKAAIAAMREPTKAMLAASRDMSPASADTIGAEYRAMIDAALQE